MLRGSSRVILRQFPIFSLASACCRHWRMFLEDDRVESIELYVSRAATPRVWFVPRYPKVILDRCLQGAERGCRHVVRWKHAIILSSCRHEMSAMGL